MPGRLPLLTVIIPTANRERFLPRAVESALASAPGGDCEVVVVPNGPDADRFAAASRLPASERIKVVPVATRHANVARNAGLAIARGEFVRFLDDDDLLYPRAATTQCERLRSSGSDVCSGGVDRVDESGRRIRHLPQPATADLAIATLVPSRTTLPTAHVFRRSAIDGLRWDEELSARQDTDWMMRLCETRELAWCRMDEPVGAWVQHSGPRVSSGQKASVLAHATAEMILRLAKALDAQGRFDGARREAAADGIWNLMQKGLMDEPDYWTRLAASAEEMAPGRHPSSFIYSVPGISSFSPLTVERMLVPLRRARLWLTGKT